MRLQCVDVRDPVDGTSALLYTSQPPSNLNVSDMISPMASKQDFSGERVSDSSSRRFRHDQPASQQEAEECKTHTKTANALQRSFVRSQASQTRP
jgi:hypothetical protein